MISTQPTVFISYSWDSNEHRAWVKALAQRLRDDGVDVKLDQWELAPGDQLTEFMERGVRDHDFAVIICTPRYRQRSDSREGGVGYEGDIMTSEVMTERNNRKFIPVWRSGSWMEASPAWLKGKYRLDLTGDPYDEREYNDLLVTLRRERPQAPPLASSTRPSIGAAKDVAAGWTLPESSGVLGQFDDIQITRVIVEEVTEPKNDGTRRSALYTVPFQLSANPPFEWAELFVQHWNRPPRFTTMHRLGIARVSGSKILLEGTTIEEVKKYHRETLQLTVGAANQDYRERVADAERRQCALEYAKAQHRRHVDAVASEITFD